MQIRTDRSKHEQRFLNFNFRNTCDVFSGMKNSWVVLLHLDRGVISPYFLQCVGKMRVIFGGIGISVFLTSYSLLRG